MPESLSHITTESQWRSLGAEIRRKILACVHVEEDSRRAEYGTLLGRYLKKPTNSGFPTGSLQRRGKPELPLPGPQNGRNGDGNADTA